ncbi:MAG: GntR family transcriptional regulator [Reyranellaceae bacterium]|uniref:GntR family transcriptional regulator n=1 Tax=Reyranella sp. TaxID=1929291 RepID=UPI00378517F6
MRRDPIPAYFRIYQVLRERIASGIYKVGTQLPTDHEIMTEFAVSRHTARSAVEELVARHLVTRFPGRGSFVQEIEPGRATDWSAQALEDLQIRAAEADFKLDKIDLVDTSEVPHAAAVLQLRPADKVMRIAWSRVRTEGPIAYCVAHLAQELATRLPPDLADRLATSRTIPLIEKHCDVRAFRVQQVSLAIAADETMARHLDVAPGAPLLLLQRTYFDIEGRPIYYSDLYTRSDRYQQKVELFRHRQNVSLSRFAPANEEDAA